MKNEEFRRATPSDDRTPLPKGETKPCMRGVLDLELYNRTGEVKLIEPLEEYVPPVDPLVAPAYNPHIKRKGNFTMNPNKPKKEVLEKDLRSGLRILNIAKKYGASVASIHNWIRSYGLAGIQGVRKMKEEPVVTQTTEVQKDHPVDEMVQESPTIDEVEQFHTDEPVQELPIVEMDLAGMTEEENMTDEEYDRIMAKVAVPVLPTVEMYEHEMRVYHCIDCGENFLSAEYSSLCNVCCESINNPAESEDQEKPDVPLSKLWEVVENGLDDIQRKYAEEADKAFHAQLVKLVLLVTKGRGLS